MTDHLSVHDRLTRLERAVQLAEEREEANLRRIEQLASRVRELEMADTRVAELESALVELKPSVS